VVARCFVARLKRFRKASNNSGSIFKRLRKRRDGTTYEVWVGQLSKGKDGKGDRERTPQVYGKTEAEVLAKLEKQKREMATGTYSDDKRTVGEYMESWLEHISLSLKGNSYLNYDYFTGKVTDKLGGVKLLKLTPAHVREMMKELAEEQSAYCANGARKILSRALKQAVKDGVIHKNSCDATKPLKHEKRPDVILTNDEVMLLLSAARTHRAYAAYYLALATGMRRGEVLGLRWEDINLEEGYLQVTKTISKNKQGRYILGKTPKTEDSRRRVMLDAETVAILQEHRLKQAAEAKDLGDAWQEEKHLGLVFTSRAGTMFEMRSYYRIWHGFQDEARAAYIALGQTDDEKQVRTKQIEVGKVFPRARPHDCRHMHVSLLNKAGVDARTIADRLGHKDPAFTLQRYAHVFEDQRKAAAIPLLRLLAPPKGEPT
jgi:integrase